MDANSTPPLGCGGLSLNDRGVERHGKRCYGALGFGGLKLEVQRACVARLFETNDQVLDAAEVLAIARELAQQTVSVVNLTRAALITADPFLRRELLLEFRNIGPETKRAIIDGPGERGPRHCHGRRNQSHPHESRHYPERTRRKAALHSKLRHLRQ